MNNFVDMYCNHVNALQVNTVQNVLVTDGTTSFAIFLYGEIQFSAGGDTDDAEVGKLLDSGMNFGFLFPY